MKIINHLKGTFRSTPAYRPFLRHKAKRQEAMYLSLREQYYQQEPDLFSPPGYLQRSLALLKKRWDGPSCVKQFTQDVRLFVIDRPAIGGPWFESELQRNFDVVVFSITRHKLGFDRGQANLVAFSSGVDMADRSRPGYQLGNSWRPWRVQLQKDLLMAISKAHKKKAIDLCFAYGSYTDFIPETFVQIKAMGIPIVLMWLDDKHAYWERPLGFPNGQKPLIGTFDVHLTNSLECMRWYMAEGAPAFYFPQGIDPELYRPMNLERSIPVSFVGQAYGIRFDLVRNLRRVGIPIQCFGSGWENGVVNSQIEIYCRSRINLGIGATGHSRLMSCVKGRDFEVPATGSLYLTSYDPELSRVFDIGKEILCYRNEIDCAEQIRYFLKRPDEAAAIGQAGRKRCLREHTWKQRMEGLLKWMGILSSEVYV